MIGDFDNVKFSNYCDTNRREFSTKELANKLKHYGIEVNHESIKKYRQGKAKPSGATIYALAKILGLCYLDLLEGLDHACEDQIITDIAKKITSLGDEDKSMILSIIEKITKNN